ncbi:hypothetical protein NKJ66_16100 [Mesorhizobium sp. M0078]|uniref:hypothetical protein n=1 Tax=Mesorhizobium sp. M0078 TaxID=2956871 RepID=UPI00333559DF
MANLGKLAIAMLGVLAYQNRDKIGDMIRGAGDRKPNDPQGGILDQLSKGVRGPRLAIFSTGSEGQAQDRRSIRG